MAFMLGSTASAAAHRGLRLMSGTRDLAVITRRSSSLASRQISLLNSVASLFWPRSRRLQSSARGLRDPDDTSPVARRAKCPN
jgi:hypothetical protein